MVISIFDHIHGKMKSLEFLYERRECPSNLIDGFKYAKEGYDLIL